MYRSKGFEVDSENYPGNVIYRPLGPIDLDKPFTPSGLTGREYMRSLVDLSLERYNRIKGTTVSCEHIVRTITAFVAGLKCYITFMARESPNGQPVEYQAKTEQRLWQKNTHVIFCRPAPKPKDDEFLFADTSSDDDSDVSSRGTGQDWDVDSLDEQPDYKSPRQQAPDAEEENRMRLYRPKMHKSKGFNDNVGGDRYSGESIYFSPVNLDEELLFTQLTGREYMEKMADLALRKYNEVKGTNVTFGHIVRANLTRVDGYKSYITFMAREFPGGTLVEYQAKTERKVWQKTAHAILCRPTPLLQD
jgi:cystatin-related protein